MIRGVHSNIKARDPRIRAGAKSRKSPHAPHTPIVSLSKDQAIGELRNRTSQLTSLSQNLSLGTESGEVNKSLRLQKYQREMIWRELRFNRGYMVKKV